ncbi:MAG: GntR family transcriptional regulator [Clostridia bacterium]|nr:GntR family transcriptional regulator [Clostridia bacterium]
MNLSASPIKSPPLYRKAHEVLRRAIIQGELKPGDRITEVQLAEELQISRTPLREALRQLQAEGLLRRSGGGLVVSPVDLSEVHLMYECRIALERLAARKAAELASPDVLDDLDRLLEEARRAAGTGDRAKVTSVNVDFHRTIAAAGGNPWTVRLLEQIWDRITLFRVSVLRASEDYDRVFREHAAILRELRRRDPDAAERAMAAHLLSDLRHGALKAEESHSARPKATGSRP